MTEPALVFLLDIDNTLIDHDGLKTRVSEWVTGNVPGAGPADFWAIYEALRAELDIVDFLEAARRFAMRAGGEAVRLEAFLWDFPFEELLLPGTAQAFPQMHSRGGLAVLCDGEAAFQCRKLERIGLLPLLSDVFVFEHKEQHLDEVEERFPGARFVLFDDKPRILRAAREHFGNRVTAVHVRHGHYATEAWDGPTASSLADWALVAGTGDPH